LVSDETKAAALLFSRKPFPEAARFLRKHKKIKFRLKIWSFEISFKNKVGNKVGFSGNSGKFPKKIKIENSGILKKCYCFRYLRFPEKTKEVAEVNK
jgi:hypothetical protein